MKYDIKAVPTEYNGTMFRSRLEATWAAMFDSLGWLWEYEGDPVGAWLPDFTIQTKAPAPFILVEIKPVFSLDEVDGATRVKVTTGKGEPSEPERLILGRGPFASPSIPSAMAFGWLYQWSETDGSAGTTWEEALINSDHGNYGLITTMCDGYPRSFGFNRMTGRSYDKPFVCESQEWMGMLWGLAKEKTQYRPR